LICILYFLLLNKFKINDEVDGTFDGIVIVSDLGLWWILLSSWRRTISTSKKFIDKYSNEKSNIEVILKDSEIIYSSVEINSVYKWSLFSKYDIYKYYLFLFSSSIMSALTIDLKTLSQEQRNELNDFLIRQYNIKGELFRKKVPKRLYFLGLLCFVPFIGAFIGILLLLLAFFDYRKNIWLVTIGCVGILITTAFCLISFS
jgi:hypothetical protein